MMHSIKNKFNFIDNHHTLQVFRNSGLASIVKVAGLGVGLGVSVFLGHTLGVEGLGIINLANRIVAIVVMICLLGVPQFLIKELAIAHSESNWIGIRNYLNSSYVVNGVVGLFVSIAFIFLSPLISDYFFNEPRLTIPLSIVGGVIVFQVLSRIFSSALIGFSKIWQSNLVNETLSLFITGIILIFLWFFEIKITIITTALSYAVGRIIVTLSIGIYWNFLFPFKGINKTKFAIPKLVRSSFPLLLVSATGLLATNIDIFMIGGLSNTRNVGLYSVAARLALIPIFFLQVIFSAISPKLATLYAENKIKEMEVMVKKVTSGMFLIATIPFIIFLMFGIEILSIWGTEFSEGYWILIVLSLGQVFNIGFGLSGLILIMCGFEKHQAYISLGSIFILIILNFILIGQYGVLGAAIATSITVTIENISKLILSKWKTGVGIFPA